MGSPLIPQPLGGEATHNVALFPFPSLPLILELLAPSLVTVKRAVARQGLTHESSSHAHPVPSLRTERRKGSTHCTLPLPHEVLFFRQAKCHGLRFSCLAL